MAIKLSNFKIYLLTFLPRHGIIKQTRKGDSSMKPKTKTLLKPILTVRNNEGATYYVVDFDDADPRFGLYIDLAGKPIKKSNNPYDFDKITLKPKGE